jgi:ketosteroid isomerase-like protein
MSASPIEIVRSIYEEFGRGDIAAMVARTHPDVQVFVHAPRTIPYGGTRRGLDEVERWFGEMGATMNFTRMEPETMIASGDEVAVRGVEAGTSTATGRSYESGFAHIWKIKDGLVLRMDDFMDSAAVAAALAA